MAENTADKALEIKYWEAYENELKPLAAEIVEHAGFLAYDLNPIGRFKDEYKGFVSHALLEVVVLETLVEKMKNLLQEYK